MKVITGSTVIVKGHTTYIPDTEHDIPDDGTDADKLCAYSAKSCYDSFGKDGRSNVENQVAVMESAHGSVTEHFGINLFIEGITRGCSLELNRHRTLSISQRSTRYTKEEDSAFVLEPYFAELWNRYGLMQKDDGSVISERGFDLQRQSTYDAHPELEVIIRHVSSCMSSIEDYKKQVEMLEKLNPQQLKGFDLRKWARGKARNVLPHALETKAMYTNNIRGWRWIIELRTERYAEPEIRVLSNKILAACLTCAPTHFNDFACTGIYDNIQEWKPKYRKI